MRNKIKKILCLIIGLVMVFGVTCSSTFAASESCTSISGSTVATKTFKVKVTPKTYGSDYIKLTHYVKGKYTYEYKLFGYWTGNHKSKNEYGYYMVTIKDPNGNIVKKIPWENQKSLTIKFGSWFKYKGSQFATKTYTVTVQPYTKSQLRSTAHYGYEYWSKHAKWKVYKTRGVGQCK